MDIFSFYFGLIFVGEVNSGQPKTETTHLQYPCSYPVRVSETERPQKDKSKVDLIISNNKKNCFIGLFRFLNMLDFLLHTIEDTGQ